MAGATFSTQADALLRKNLTFQSVNSHFLIAKHVIGKTRKRRRAMQLVKRNKRSNIALIVFPVLLCILLTVLQKVLDDQIDQPQFKCGCNPNNNTECGLQYSDNTQASFCAVRDPPKWPALLQLPSPEYRAVRTNYMPFSDLPDESCRKTGSCPASILLTGNNQSFAQSLEEYMLNTTPLNASDPLASLSSNGSASIPSFTGLIDTAFTSNEPLYHVQPECRTSPTILVPITIGSITVELEIKCAQGRLLWRNSSSEINEELYQGYLKGNSERKINELVTAYDFLNSNEKSFNVSIWYNATYSNDSGYNNFRLIAMTRVPRSVNMASNAYLQLKKGAGTKSDFRFVKDMPKQETKLRFDLSSLLSAQFFTYVIVALFPTVLTFLVYENQNRLRMMMKMHGLGDGPYWLISYAYFLALSSIYMLCFVTFGSLIGLKIFTMNDYSIQFVFFFIYINLQISFAFLLAPLFSNVLTARVVGYIVIFGSGLLGAFLFIAFVEDTSFPKKWVIAMELYPGFSLYRGLYELGQYSNIGNIVGTHGMKWENLGDNSNGMKEILIVMFVEWLIVLPVAYYVDQALLSGSGMNFFSLLRLPNLWKRSAPFIETKPSLQKSSSKVFVQMEKPDVLQERQKVEQVVQDRSLDAAIVCDNLAKVYPGRDGNPPKAAVRGLSLALPRGECFGMLGPNGAGKTSFISMMIGLSKPSSGKAYVDGKDILSQMDEIYTNMGVCPQHDLLWESLTGREHLLFYGRLKNLKGDALKQAVEESLKSVNLFHGGVGDKFAGKYSGGMKRRLSVAISLIGDPKVVYMDEPSTGLDPASRNNLWNVVRRAKQERAIILTTHSMEEAEVLCDRLGIFVDGSLQCIGNPKEVTLKARYGGSFVFTITTDSSQEAEVESMVRRLSPSAQKVYHISGTQKFELPKEEVKTSDVFRAVQKAKSRFIVYAWGLTDTTLEDVFIKVARDAQPFYTLS
ncbi:hypothetical protein V2J09_019830 [Rumex salicifolius]